MPDSLKNYLILLNDSGETRMIHYADLVTFWQEVDEDWRERSHGHTMCPIDDREELIQYLEYVGYYIKDTTKWERGDGEF